MNQRSASCSCGQLSLAIDGDPVGAFADPAFPPPIYSVYEERQHAWVRLPEDIEHHA